MRWFGNMLRTSGRAIALGPGRIGFFTWWSLVDQRISMWTSLAGAVFAILGSLFITPYAIIIYIAWIMGSRFVVTAVLLTVRKEVSLWYPFLLWYNQVVGSLIKTFIVCHMQRQKWTRQQTVLRESRSVLRRATAGLVSHYVHVISLSALFVVIAVWIDIIPVPNEMLHLFQ
jgi:glycosyltransferase Alg8